MKIYLARNNIQAGPYTLEELNAMLSSGEVLLDDLAWHSGMTAWERLGNLTGNRLYYQPYATPPPPATPVRGFGDNVELNPHPTESTESKRVSVAELYGRKSAEPTKTTIVLTKPTSQATEYASIGSRFLAFAVNVALYLLALLPLILAFTNVIDMNEFSKIAQTQDFIALQTYSQGLASKIPTTTTAISNIMLFALIGIQLLLIIMRGQSFGKLVMGIRVVNQDTHKLPSLGNLLFMRTVFLVTAYFVGMSTFSGLPAMIMLSANYLMANASPTKQGWHDRLTKTLVVKAQPSQLDKTHP